MSEIAPVEGVPLEETHLQNFFDPATGWSNDTGLEQCSCVGTVHCGIWILLAGHDFARHTSTKGFSSYDAICLF